MEQLPETLDTEDVPARKKLSAGTAVGKQAFVLWLRDAKKKHLQAFVALLVKMF